MNSKPYNIISHKETELGRFVIVQDEIERNDDIFPYSFEKVDDSACVIAFNNGKIVMIKQYRHALGEWMYEFPGGGLGGDLPEMAVRRELHEETGYLIRRIGFLGCFPISPGTSSARVYAYYAECEKDCAQQLDGTEIIEVCEVSREELEKMIYDGSFIFLAGVVMWQLFKHKEDEGLLWT